MVLVGSLDCQVSKFTLNFTNQQQRQQPHKLSRLEKKAVALFAGSPDTASTQSPPQKSYTNFQHSHIHFWKGHIILIGIQFLQGYSYGIKILETMFLINPIATHGKSLPKRCLSFSGFIFYQLLQMQIFCEGHQVTPAEAVATGKFSVAICPVNVRLLCLTVHSPDSSSTPGDLCQVKTFPRREQRGQSGQCRLKLRSRMALDT